MSTYLFYKQSTNGSKSACACFNAETSKSKAVFCIQLQTLLSGIESTEIRNSARKKWEVIIPKAPVSGTDELESRHVSTTMMDSLLTANAQQSSTAMMDSGVKAEPPLMDLDVGAAEPPLMLDFGAAAPKKMMNPTITTDKQKSTESVIYLDLFHLPCADSVDLQTVCSQLVRIALRNTSTLLHVSNTF